MKFYFALVVLFSFPIAAFASKTQKTQTFPSSSLMLEMDLHVLQNSNFRKNIADLIEKNPKGCLEFIHGTIPTLYNLLIENQFDLHHFPTLSDDDPLLYDAKENLLEDTQVFLQQFGLLKAKLADQLDLFNTIEPSQEIDLEVLAEDLEDLSNPNNLKTVLDNAFGRKERIRGVLAFQGYSEIARLLFLSHSGVDQEKDVIRWFEENYPKSNLVRSIKDFIKNVEKTLGTYFGLGQQTYRSRQQSALFRKHGFKNILLISKKSLLLAVSHFSREYGSVFLNAIEHPDFLTVKMPEIQREAAELIDRIHTHFSQDELFKTLFKFPVFPKNGLKRDFKNFDSKKDLQDLEKALTQGEVQFLSLFLERFPDFGRMVLMSLDIPFPQDWAEALKRILGVAQAKEALNFRDRILSMVVARPADIAKNSVSSATGESRKNEKDFLKIRLQKVFNLAQENFLLATSSLLREDPAIILGILRSSDPEKEYHSELISFVNSMISNYGQDLIAKYAYSNFTNTDTLKKELMSLIDRNQVFDELSEHWEVGESEFLAFFNEKWPVLSKLIVNYLDAPIPSEIFKHLDKSQFAELLRLKKSIEELVRTVRPDPELDLVLQELQSFTGLRKSNIRQKLPRLLRMLQNLGENPIDQLVQKVERSSLSNKKKRQFKLKALEFKITILNELDARKTSQEVMNLKDFENENTAARPTQVPLKKSTQLKVWKKPQAESKSPRRRDRSDFINSLAPGVVLVGPGPRKNPMTLAKARALMDQSVFLKFSSARKDSTQMIKYSPSPVKASRSDNSVSVTGIAQAQAPGLQGGTPIPFNPTPPMTPIHSKPFSSPQAFFPAPIYVPIPVAVPVVVQSYQEVSPRIPSPLPDPDQQERMFEDPDGTWRPKKIPSSVAAKLDKDASELSVLKERLEILTRDYLKVLRENCDLKNQLKNSQ